MTRDAQRVASAARMRAFRGRRAAGLVRLVVDLDETMIGRLVEGRWLAAADRQDRGAVARALCALLQTDAVIAPKPEPTFAELLAAAFARHQARGTETG